MTTKVWSYTIGNWESARGYELVPMGTLANLLIELDSRRLHDKVSELVIFAHGDQGGLVQIRSSANSDKDLTPDTVAEFLPYFHKLGDFLTRTADLAFFGCVCAQGPRGDRLLTKISGALRGRRIVGFNTFLWYGGGLYRSLPGQVKDTMETRPMNLSADPNAYKGRPLLTIHSDSAKWVIDGVVRKRPKGDGEFTEGKPIKIKKLPLFLDKELYTCHQRFLRATNRSERDELGKEFRELMRARERQGKYYEVPARR